MTTAPLSVLVPVLAATLLAATSPLSRRRAAGVLAVLAALAMAVLCALTLGRASDRTLVLWFGGWTPRDGAAVGIDFAVDPLGAAFALFIAVLGVAALVMCVELIRVEDHLFDAIALIFLAAMAGFCLTGDLFNLFVFFELMSVCAYVLVGYEVRRRAPLAGSLAFAITNTIGSIFLLFGITLLYGRTGALNLAQIGRALAEGPADGLVVCSYALIAGGLLVKAAAVPFHFWTADAYAVAPTPVGLLLAGAFSELGLFGLARVHWTVFHDVLAPHEAELRAIFVGLGLLTAVVGAVMCAAQHHLKRMLAFATISHVGLFLVGVGVLEAGGLAGAAVWVAGDGLVKAALFGAVGMVNDRCGTVDECELHGRGRALRPLGALFCLGALAVATLPPFGPFLGKALVEDALLKAGGYGWALPVMVVVSALTGGALLRAGLRVFYGLGRRAPEDPAAAGGERDAGREDEGPERPDRTSPLLWAPAVALLAAGLVWGVVPGLVDAAAGAAARFTDTAGYAELVLRGRATQVPAPELHGPGATAYLYAAASVIGALAAAGAALAGARDRAPSAARRALAALRDLHSGRPGDYAAWAAAGIALLGGLMAVAVGG
jgi:multicomponent Na+:H+ antiporter subunit D